MPGKHSSYRNRAKATARHNSIKKSRKKVGNKYSSALKGAY